MNRPGNGIVKEELLIRDKHDNKICCICSFATIEMDDGLALSFILTDLTLQKTAQKQLIVQNEELEAAQNQVTRQNDELEDTVKERTRDLTVSREHFKLLADHITQMTWTNLPNGDMNFYNQRWYELYRA